MAVDREFEYIVWRFRFLTERSEGLRPNMAWPFLASRLGLSWLGLSALEFARLEFPHAGISALGFSRWNCSTGVSAPEFPRLRLRI